MLVETAGGGTDTSLGFWSGFYFCPFFIFPLCVCMFIEESSVGLPVKAAEMYQNNPSLYEATNVKCLLKCQCLI